MCDCTGCGNCLVSKKVDQSTCGWPHGKHGWQKDQKRCFWCAVGSEAKLSVEFPCGQNEVYEGSPGSESNIHAELLSCGEGEFTSARESAQRSTLPEQVMIPTKDSNRDLQKRQIILMCDGLADKVLPMLKELVEQSRFLKRVREPLPSSYVMAIGGDPSAR
jgi:hypothetical protein